MNPAGLDECIEIRQGRRAIDVHIEDALAGAFEKVLGEFQHDGVQAVRNRQRIGERSRYSGALVKRGSGRTTDRLGHRHGLTTVIAIVSGPHLPGWGGMSRPTRVDPENRHG